MKLNKYQHDTYLSIDSEIQYDKHTTSTWQFLLSTFAFFRKIAHFLLDRVACDLPLRITRYLCLFRCDGDLYHFFADFLQ